MHSVVSQFTVPEIPEPMPVIGRQVLVKRLFRSGAQPQIPVQVGRRRLRALETQGFPFLEMDAASHVDFANHPIVQRLHGLP